MKDVSRRPTFELLWHVATEEVSPGRWRSAATLLPDVQVQGDVRSYEVTLVGNHGPFEVEANQADLAEDILHAGLWLYTDAAAYA